MKINSVEEFWEALEACRNFASENQDEHRATLFCVGGYEDRVGFLLAGFGKDLIAANCCAIDNDQDCKEVWSETSIAFAKARGKNVRVIHAEDAEAEYMAGGGFPIKPNQIKS
ncbi:MAG: hypothetical protein IK114_14100 [Fibrobacter sp.]|nr:hypothetical protein [Fibrobacter sp.]